MGARGLGSIPSSPTQMKKNIKIVISAGGRGTRVPEITSGIIPKGLSRIINKRLLSYQLWTLYQLGIREIFTSIEEDWHIGLFKESIRIGEFPPMRYFYGKHQWTSHPLRSFADKEINSKRNVFDFIGEDDFIWTYGDLFYDRTLINKLINRAKQNQTSVGCQIISRRPQPFEKNQFIQFIKNKNGRILDYKKVKRLKFSIHAPFFFRNQELSQIKKELTMNPPHTRRLLMRIHDTGGGLSLINPTYLYNMNWPEDVLLIKKILRRRK